jgi:hypothetical protein
MQRKLYNTGNKNIEIMEQNMTAKETRLMLRKKIKSKRETILQNMDKI